MRITKQARREAKALLRACQVNGVLDAARTRQAVSQVIQVKPRGYLAVLTHFQRLLKLEIQRRSGRIESAVPLSAELQANVQASLASRYGPGLDLAFAPNPALIGGMRIQVGSDVYDGSVRARLAALNESF